MGNVNTSNDFMIGARGKQLMPLMPILITTRQQAFRAAVWIALMGDLLPDEDPASTFDEVHAAIRST